MSPPSIDELLSELALREKAANEGGGEARAARQRKLGRLTARERVAGLLDLGSFVELGRHVLHRHSSQSERLAANRHPGDGLVCGLGTVEGQTVAVYAHDPTVLRGALGHAAAQKLCQLLDLALARRHPVLALVDCDGVRVEEGSDAIDAYGEVIHRTILLQGKVPQLTLVCGLAVGAAAYNAALTDCVGMVEGQSYLFITGPKVTKIVTGEDVDLDALGGPLLHAKKTGACHALLPDERAGLAWLKQLLGLFRERSIESADPVDRPTQEISTLVPLEPRRAYDMRKVLAVTFDQGTVLELSPRFAPNLLTAFARLGGRSVAVVASQPMVLAGCLDVDASRKAAAFVRWAGALGLPTLTLVDVPGYLPGARQEAGGIVPHGATLLSAYGASASPQICLVVRNSFGGASVLSFAAQVRLALPTARVGPMGADASAEVVLGPPPEGAEAIAKRDAQVKDWLERHDHAWAGAEAGYLDQVIHPAQVRRALFQAVCRLSG